MGENERLAATLRANTTLECGFRHHRPMTTLWIDVDGTLVLWADESNPFMRGWDRRSMPFTFNFRLISAIRRFQTAHPDWVVSCWSSGGDWYALLWASRIGVEYNLNFDCTHAKDPRILGNGDVWVDDQFEFTSTKVRYETMSPEEFIEAYKSA